ncbi:MAG: hypothetical protein DRN81_02955 [Thermoproteota archaeon]|nr:MAG: hypothetical protein DRN81_02955 [Candidatus Korarchaeota archaeon]
MSKREDVVHTICKEYSDVQLLDIVIWRRQDVTWPKISDKFNKKYRTDKTAGALRHAHQAYGNLFERSDPEFQMLKMRDIQRTKRSNSKTAKENRIILDQTNAQEDILSAISDVVKAVNKQKPVKLRKDKAKGKHKMTIEMLLGDLHLGKKTKSFDESVAKRRLEAYTSSVIKKIERESKTYNVERIILAILGDLLENFQMHGIESARGCEFGNPEQIQKTIELIFSCVVQPLAQLGIPMDVVGITGNHDRTDIKRTYHNPGVENFTWVIYNTLKMLSEKVGYKHLTYHIPTGPYQLLTVYGDVILYEHFDNARQNNRNGLQTLMMNRQNQLKDQLSDSITFMRGGHFHEFSTFGRGTIITNGCICGQDSFADVLGYNTEACQVVNSYIETKKRPTSFYESFPVYLA